MRTISLLHSRHWACWICLALGVPSLAGPASDQLLPNTTKAYISIGHPEEFEARWDTTQLGQLFDDEVMQPFRESLRKQLRDKYRVFEDKLGIEWEDLKGVPAGELSLALIDRSNKEAALAITIDVTGRTKEAAALVAAASRRFAARGGSLESATREGTTLQIFTVPADEGRPLRRTVYFVKDNVLCGVDDPAEADRILKRFAGSAPDSLKTVNAYIATMDRCRREAGELLPEARWYVDPFGALFAARTLEKSNGKRREKDVAKILFENGFDAIRGVGGYFNQMVDGHLETLYRVAVYAPPAAGKEGDPLRWNASMRMLQLPNVAGFEPQSWVPRMSAGYATFQLQVDTAFDHVGPLVDALQDHEGAWANTLEGWATDPFGPKVDVRKEFIANLGRRITIVTAYDIPISVGSERAIFAIEATNEKALAQSVERWMTKEPDVVRRDVGPYVIWERVPQQLAGAAEEIEVPGFTPLRASTEDKANDLEQRERVLPNSAVCVALGHLMMASDIEHMREVLEGFAQRERLASSADYQAVSKTLASLAPGERSGWSFGRSDEEFRPTYELIRRGKMPEAKTMLGKMLNNLLTTEVEREEGGIRRQRIDGSSLPDFEMVRRYLGPTGRVVRSDPDGWFITVAVLNKDAM